MSPVFHPRLSQPMPCEPPDTGEHRKLGEKQEKLLLFLGEMGGFIAELPFKGEDTTVFFEEDRPAPSLPFAGKELICCRADFLPVQGKGHIAEKSFVCKRTKDIFGHGPWIVPVEIAEGDRGTERKGDIANVGNGEAGSNQILL